VRDPNAFTGAPLDRAEDGRRRNTDWVAAQFEHGAARALVAGDAGVLMEGELLARVPLTEASAEGRPPFLLGLDDEGPLYQSSQPWPFPASLMLGFTVPWRGGELGGSDPELEDKRWFGREEVAGAAREDSWSEPDGGGNGLLLPPRAAIARRLIEGWLSG